MKYNLAKIAVITLTFGALAIGLPNTGRAQPSTRTVQVVNATGSPGVLVNVAVALTAQGDENTVGFSLTFDSSSLTYVSSAKGSAMSAGTMFLNTNSAPTGTIGVLLGLQPGDVFPIGNQQLAIFTFQVSEAVVGPIYLAINFANQPTRTQVVSADASVLSATFTGGSVTVTPFPLVVTANDQSRPYGAANPVLTGSIAGLQPGDNITATYSTAADTTSPVGNYPITVTLSDPDSKLSKYSVTTNNGTLAVTQAPLDISANSTSKSYGQTVTFAGTEFTTGAGELVNGDSVASVTLSSAGTAATAGIAGSPYAIAASAATGTGLGNYAISYHAGALTVSPAGLTITANNQGKAYGAAVPVLTVGYSGFVNGDTAASLTTAPTVTTTGTASSAVGTYPITASGAVDANYTISYVPGTLTVNPAGLTITANNQSKAYGAALPVLTVGYSGFVNGDTAASLTTAPTVTTTGTASSAVGTYPITASGAVDANYTISYVPGTLTVNPAGLTITANNQSKAYGAAVPVLTVGYSGFVNGDTAASLTTPPAVTTTGTASSAVGTYPISASGAADANYTISYVPGTLTVNPAGLTITANNQGKAYGAALPALTVSYSGFVNGDTAASLTTAPTVTATGTASSAVGTYPITASGAADANYTISYVAGTLTVNPAGLTITANNQGKAYGAALPVLTVGYSGFVNGDTAASLTTAPVVTTTGTASSAVGTYPITASGAVDANYTISYVPGTLTVNPAGLTITANNQSKAYGAAVPVLTVSYSGFVNGDTAASLTTPPAVTTTGTASSAVGTYPITASGAVDANYTISYVPGTLTVNPAGLTITANNQGKAYGAALPALTVGYSGFVNGDTAASLTTAPAMTTTGTASSAVGTYPITASGAVDANYTISYVPGTLTVNPAGLTITANNQGKAYGAALPALTVGYSGFVNGDTAASLSTAPVVTTTGTASSAVGTYPITASGAVDANYTISYVAGTLTVSPVGLTITANNQSKAYGAALPVLTVSYSGFVNGDTAASLSTAPVVTTTGTASSAVGTYPITASGAVDANYTISYVAGTLTVRPVALVVTANDASRAYGATNPVFSASYSGFVNGETNDILSGVLVFTCSAETNSPVGTYPIEPSGLTAANYSITFSNGTLTVKPYALTVTADDQTKTYGQADPGFTVNYSGFVNGESASVLGGTLAFSRASGEAVGGYTITPSGLTSTSYAITFVNGTLTINPAGLTITADNQSKAYGAALPVLTVSYSGFVNGDTAASLTTAPAVTTAGTANSAVGTYPITASGALDANYTINYVAGTLTVSPAGLTITANNQSKAYGAALPVLTVSYSGFVNGDTAASLTTPPAVTTTGTASSAVGTYPITASGAVDANYTISYMPGTLTVSPVALVVTANDASRVYGATNPVFTGTITGLQNGDNITATYATTATVSSPVGTYSITPTLVDPSGKLNNYTMSSTSGTLRISEANSDTVVTSSQNPSLYGSNVTFTVTVTPTEPTTATPRGSVRFYANGIALGGSVALSGGVASLGTAVLPVGTNVVGAAYLGDGNYLVSSNSLAQMVSSVALVVTANDASRAYGATNPVFTGTITGPQNGDNITATYATTATVSSPVGAYSITPTLVDPSGKLNNYIVSSTSGTLRISEANSDTVVTSSQNPSLYGSNVTFTVTVTPTEPTTATPRGSVRFYANGIALGGSVALSGGVASLGTAVLPVGTNVVGAAYLGDGNYLVSSNSLAQMVSSVALVVTANDASRAYGATNPVFTGTITGLQNGDNITATYATTATVSSPVGAYSITPTLVDPSGKLNNYIVSSTSGTLRISEANSDTVVTSSQNPSLYGSNVTFTVTVTPTEPTTAAPRGSVRFYANGIALGGSVALSGGVASLGTAVLPVGTNVVGAAYLGDGNYLVSSNSLAQVVSVNVQKPATVGIKDNGDGYVTVSFSGTPGALYIVQAKSDLAPATAWTNVSTNLAGTDGQWSFTDSMADHPIRFYRAMAP